MAHNMVSTICRVRDAGVERMNAIPYSFIALIARAATFSVFFRAGSQKLADWPGTVYLFANEYHVPLLPPGIAAVTAATMELTGSTLVLLGLFTRPAAIALLGMIAVIQIFVYPDAWPDHIQWLAFMSILIARGPGRASLDYALGRLMRAQARVEMKAHA